MTKKRKRKKSSLWSRGMSAQLCCQRQCRTDIQALAPPQRAQPHLCVRDPDDVIGPGDPVLGRGAGKAHTHTHICVLEACCFSMATCLLFTRVNLLQSSYFCYLLRLYVCTSSESICPKITSPHLVLSLQPAAAQTASLCVCIQNEKK